MSNNTICIELNDWSNIIETTNKLKPKLSSGRYDISTKLLQDILSDIIIPITHIIYGSLFSGRVPDQLHISKVIPIYRASDPHQLQNFSQVYNLHFLN